MGDRRTLGRFVCGERVASGPVGALHRGRVFGDAGFEKDFALLVVDAELARDRAALGRLVRAANGWARLNYPRIAHAHELSVEGETYFQTIEAITRRAPSSVKKLRKDAPEALVAVIERMLKKAPADRYQSAADIAVDLRRLEDQP